MAAFLLASYGFLGGLITFSTLTAMLYLLVKETPLKTSFLYLFGIFLAALGAGALLLFGLGPAIHHWIFHEKTALTALKIVLLTICLLWALAPAKSRAFRLFEEKELPPLSPLAIFWLGFGLNLLQIPTNVVYLFALERLLHADLPWSIQLLRWSWFLLWTLAPLLLLLFAAHLFRPSFLHFATWVNQFITRFKTLLIRIFLLALSSILLFDLLWSVD